MQICLCVSKYVLVRCQGSPESGPGRYPQAVEVVTWDSLGCRASPLLEMGFVEKNMSLGARRPAAPCPPVSVTGSAISSKPLKSSRPRFTHLYKKGVHSVAEQTREVGRNAAGRRWAASGRRHPPCPCCCRRGFPWRVPHATSSCPSPGGAGAREGLSVQPPARQKRPRPCGGRQHTDERRSPRKRRAPGRAEEAPQDGGGAWGRGGGGAVRSGRSLRGDPQKGAGSGLCEVSGALQQGRRL